MAAEAGDLLSVEVRADGDRAVVVVAGELDADTVAALDRALSALRSSTVLLDLGSVGFLDTRALEVLIRHQVALRDDGRTLDVVRRSRQVDRVLEATRTTRFFPLPTG